jgi:hydroxymethylbilane synthase
MTGTVILAAHGAGDGSEANAAVHGLAEELQARGDVPHAVAAFHLGSPHFSTVLDDVDADVVTVVPVMTSLGHYAELVLPRELARCARYPAVSCHITEPLGTHPRLVEITQRRIAALAARFDLDPMDCHVLIVGHGTPRNHSSRLATETLAARIQATTVHAAFLEEPPTVDQACDGLPPGPLIVVPFLIGGGTHAMHDIPRELGLQADSWPATGTVGDRRILCEHAVGTWPELLDVVRDRLRPTGPAVHTSGRDAALRLGTRNSPLARWQAEFVGSRLQAHGHQVTVVEFTTSGDRDPSSAIADLPSSAPFTDDIDTALHSGDIDVAVHSLKDLSLKPSAALQTVAIMQRGAAGEALVTRTPTTVDGLPEDAIVGTSAPRRAAQILAIRPDLECRPIRGPVQSRIQQVLDGAFDAAVLAIAGLQRLGCRDHWTALPIAEFLPAPGQGAVALQARADDAHTARICATLHDSGTGRAVASELALQGCVDQNSSIVCAAWAIGNTLIHLHGRLLAPDGRWTRDVLVRGRDPQAVGREAFERLSTTAVRGGET